MYYPLGRDVSDHRSLPNQEGRLCVSQTPPGGYEVRGYFTHPHACSCSYCLGTSERLFQELRAKVCMCPGWCVGGFTGCLNFNGDAQRTVWRTGMLNPVVLLRHKALLQWITRTGNGYGTCKRRKDGLQNFRLETFYPRLFCSQLPRLFWLTDNAKVISQPRSAIYLLLRA